MTQLALIYDENVYKIVKFISQDKKSCLIELLEQTPGGNKKIKLENLILQFENPDYAVLLEIIRKICEQMDYDLIWELTAHKQLWPWDELCSLYFNKVDSVHKVGLFMALCNPAIYFGYKDGQFKRCNQEEVVQHKLQLAKEHEYRQKFDALYAKLVNKERPDWDSDPLTFLDKPDKNSLEYKAFHKAAKDLKLSIAELLFALGYIKSVEELLTTNFIRLYFPRGAQLPDVKINDHSDEIPLNTVLKVFSIDDSTTTEVDDAFSIQTLADGLIIGIHISAPALNLELLPIASSRISTVYYPGHKITMLPEHIIAHYSLDEGKMLPVVSIYFTLDEQFNILNQETRLERVIVSNNLRTEELGQLFNHENLEVDHGYPYEKELKLLYKFALYLEDKRGRPSVSQSSVDYNFSFTPEGKIVITPRVRGNPIDKLVSELMILANGSWGRLLTNSFIPAIYRVKQPKEPVVMTLTPNSHVGLNVDYYTWATSPLRRSVDLVNQAQIISLLTHAKPLAATDFAVANVVENFDETYLAYLKFQDKMEYYWSLRYFLQENISQINATFTYKSNVQLDGVPITLDVGHLINQQPSGKEIRLAITDINLINQTFSYRIIA